MKKFRNILCYALACLMMSLAGHALANSGGGKEASAGGAATAKLEAFTVNLSGFDRYLQVSITLQIATPEVGEKIKTLMPIVRHKMILMLGNKEAADLQSADGKHHLIDEIKDAVNGALEVKERDGVTDVFFENFVIQ